MKVSANNNNRPNKTALIKKLLGSASSRNLNLREKRNQLIDLKKKRMLSTLSTNQKLIVFVEKISANLTKKSDRLKTNFNGISLSWSKPKNVILRSSYAI